MSTLTLDERVIRAVGRRIEAQLDEAVLDDARAIVREQAYRTGRLHDGLAVESEGDDIRVISTAPYSRFVHDGTVDSARGRLGSSARVRRPGVVDPPGPTRVEEGRTSVHALGLRATGRASTRRCRPYLEGRSAWRDASLVSARSALARSTSRLRMSRLRAGSSRIGLWADRSNV